MSNVEQIIYNEVESSAVFKDGKLVSFVCRFCSKKIARRDYFTLHIQRQHNVSLNIPKPPKNHVCPHVECDFRFYSKGELSSHIRNRHIDLIEPTVTVEPQDQSESLSGSLSGSHVNSASAIVNVLESSLEFVVENEIEIESIPLHVSPSKEKSDSISESSLDPDTMPDSTSEDINDESRDDIAIKINSTSTPS